MLNVSAYFSSISFINKNYQSSFTKHLGNHAKKRRKKYEDVALEFYVYKLNIQSDTDVHVQ